MTPRKVDKRDVDVAMRIEWLQRSAIRYQWWEVDHVTATELRPMQLWQEGHVVEITVIKDSAFVKVQLV